MPERQNEPTDATLRIGCVAELALQQVQSFVGALYASDPHLEIELRHLPSAAQVRALRAGGLLLGLAAAPAPPPGTRGVPFCRGGPLGALGPLGRRLARARGGGRGDLRQED